MGFSCLLGITRVANVFTILAFVAEFMKCEISDITSSIIHIVQLTVLVLDIVLTGAKIIISIGVNMTITGLSIVIETAMQFLPCMKINVWIIILSTCIIMTSILVDCWVQCCIIGANLIRRAENKPPGTPLYHYKCTNLTYRLTGELTGKTKIVKCYTSPRDLGVRVGFYGVRIQFGGQGGIRNNDLLSNNFHLDLTMNTLNILWKFLLGVAITVEVAVATVSLAALLYTEVKSLIFRTSGMILRTSGTLNIKPQNVANAYLRIIGLNIAAISGMYLSVFGLIPDNIPSKTPEEPEFRPETSKMTKRIPIIVRWNKKKTAIYVATLGELKTRVAEIMHRKNDMRMLAQAHVRGRYRYLSHDSDLEPGLIVDISPVGRGGMKSVDPLSESPVTKKTIGLVLEGTPSPSQNERVFRLEEPPSDNGNKITGDKKRRQAISFADRSTVASEAERVSIPFTDVRDLERKLEDAQKLNEELQAKDRKKESKRVEELEAKLENALAYIEQLESGDANQHEENFERVFQLEAKFEEVMKKLQDERARVALNEHPPETHGGKSQRDTQAGRDDRRAKRFSMSTPSPETRKNTDKTSDSDEEEPNVDAYLGNTPEKCDNLPDVSSKPVAERTVTLLHWVQRLKAWIENTCSDGTPIFEMIRDAAEAYYLQWLEESANPVRRTQITLDQISPEHDVSRWKEYLTRAYSRISKTLPGKLYSEHLNDLTGVHLSAFQRVTSILVTAMTNYGAQNLQEHTQLVRSFARPLDWLNGSIYKDQETGWAQLSTLLNIMKHANDVLPSIVHVDTGSLNLGVRSLLNHTMSHCDKIESDELSEVARSTGIFKYTNNLPDMCDLIRACMGVARHSKTYVNNVAKIEAEKKKKKDEKTAAQAHTAQGQPAKDKAKEKGKPKGLGKTNKDGKTPEGKQGASNNQASGPNTRPWKGASKGSYGSTGKNSINPGENDKKLTAAFHDKTTCRKCKKSIDDKEAHPEGKPCIFLCWQCGEPRDNKTAHPDGKWCDSSSDPKNDQAPAPRAGPGKE